MDSCIATRFSALPLVLNRTPSTVLDSGQPLMCSCPLTGSCRHETVHLDFLKRDLANADDYFPSLFARLPGLESLLQSDYSTWLAVPPRTRVASTWERFLFHPSQWWDSRWNKSEEGHATEVESLDLLLDQGSHFDSPALYDLLKKSIADKDIILGTRVHALAVKYGHESNTLLANHIIRMYSSHGKLQEATNAFTSVAAPDRYMWASIILAHARHAKPKEAVQLYRQMMKESVVQPDNHIFVAVLTACAAAKDLAAGREVHADILGTADKPNLFVGSALVNMYAKCGNLQDARRVFDSMPSKNVVTWNAMISGYAQYQLGQEALTLYQNMQREGVIAADAVTLVCLLQACASVRALDQGKQLHAHIHKKGLSADVAVGNSLVSMYAKCDSLGDARQVFDNLLTKDLVTWNAMITGYVQHGLGEEALALYECMQQDGKTSADAVTFVSLLNACSSVSGLEQGKKIHAQISMRGLGATDLFVCNALIDMYSKCGSLQDARRVFDGLSTRDVVTWTAMIAACARHGFREEALKLLADMEQEGTCLADAVTFVCLLQACARAGALLQGEVLHEQARQRGLDTDVQVGSSLVDMYAKCGSLNDARQVFDTLPTRDVVTWNAMIAGYVQHGFSQQALALYANMQREGITSADHVTFVCLLQACSSAGALHEGKWLHAQIQQRGLELDVAVGSGLVDMYAKCGSLEDARALFHRLPAKNVVTWNAMIAGFAQHGLGQEALALYAHMQEDGVAQADEVTFVCLLQGCASVGALNQGKHLHSKIQEMGLEDDVVIGSSLVDMYAKCGSLLEAQRVFNRLSKKNVVTWNALLGGYSQHSDGQMAIQCFEDMCRQGVQVDDTTFICLLVACSHAGLVNEGLQYFRMMAEHGIVASVNHYNCMIDLLGRSGHLSEAENLLRTMPHKTDVVGWTSLLSACKSHGDVERGKRCFDRLIELEPECAPAFMLLGNIYAYAGRWKDVHEIESRRKSAGAWKKPAKAYIELKEKVHEFTVGEERADISNKLKSIKSLLKKGGHVPHTQLVLKAVSEQEKADALCGHAEKLALAYGLLNTSDGTTLLVTKNLRMCNDCHSSTKIMSQLEKREIIVRDSHRVHHFLDGSCSCRDRH